MHNQHWIPRTPRQKCNYLRFITIAFGGVVSFVCTAALAGAFFALKILSPAKHPDQRVEVWGLDEVPLTESPVGLKVWLSGPDADLAGNYSFIFDNHTGHARLGPVIDRILDGRHARIARNVIAIDRGKLNVGSRGRVTGWWYHAPEELNFSTDSVLIATSRGPLHAWVVTPSDAVPGRWAIHVHGRGALPEETLRGVPPVARAGVTSLIINYRNDPHAPKGIRGRYGLGLAERFDVDTAIRWVLERGADRVTLVGWSMGGTTVLVSATRGPYRGWIDGLVLDTPGVDWKEILRTQALLARVPAFIANIGMILMQHGLVPGGHPDTRMTDIRSLTPARFARDLTTPVLIHTGPGDTFVPWNGARALAKLRPDLVQIRAAQGEHVKVWNVAPQEWEKSTEIFVRSLEVPPAHLLRPKKLSPTASR